MALMLGIDTGGTFTDAVLVTDDADASVVASAKSPTTHHDLAVGVGKAVAKVVVASGQSASAVALVSVSTTLATNALVEGHGQPVALLTFGFSRREIERTGLERAVPAELIVSFDGGHDAHGNEQTPLDLDAITAEATRLAPQVSAFAVASQFSVRNPEHERAAAEAIRATTGLPVTSSHELSAKLDGPRRALTATLNARLLGTIDRLNQAVQSVLGVQGIDAPLMVVRGDGSLVSAPFAAQRPIETVLSGPAASVIGALHLAQLDDGLVVDIGGTTTDVAVVSGGRPSITATGAVIGAHRTMVEAVDMATVGLGGDSEVRVDTLDQNGPILLGPERAIPICRLAIDHPTIHAQLDHQLATPTGLTSHGRFLVSVAPLDTDVADEREATVLARLQNGPVPQTQAVTSGLESSAARRLRARGLVRVATMTPTDASAIVGTVSGVDAEAALKVAQILARQTSSTGGALAAGGEALAQIVIELLINRSADFVLRVALRSDGLDDTGSDVLLNASLARHCGATSVAIKLASGLTAIGAPAGTYYPHVGDLVGVTTVVPEYAEVANAVGAVVGRVRVTQRATITQPTRGQYRVHLEDQPTFGSVENARAHAVELLRAAASREAEAAGAGEPKLTERWEERVAEVNGKVVFVEGLLIVEASGRPRL